MSNNTLLNKNTDIIKEINKNLNKLVELRIESKLMFEILANLQTS